MAKANHCDQKTGEPMRRLLSRYGLPMIAAIFMFEVEVLSQVISHGTLDHGPAENRILSVLKTRSHQSPLYVADTVVALGLRDTLRILYSYDPEGRRLSDVTQGLKSGQWVDTLRMSRSYDADGNVLAVTHEQWSAGWRGFYRWTTAYDVRGRPLIAHYYQWWSNRWEMTGRRTYSYGADGRDTELGEGWSAGQWVSTSRRTLAHDGNGRLLGQLDEGFSDGQWQNVYSLVHTYDASGNMLTWLEQRSWRNGQWNDGTLFTYTYDTKGRRLTMKFAMMMNGEWGRERVREAYGYGANGGVQSIVREKLGWFNVWENDQRVTYTYDAWGRVILRLEEHWETQWVNAYRIAYVYDPDGRLLLELWEQSMGASWENELRVVCAYDANGNFSEMSREDWQNGTWEATDWSWNLVDSAGNQGHYYGHRVIVKYRAMATEAVNDETCLASGYELLQNFPNPFNPTTVVRYQVPVGTSVTLGVYDMLGREVAVLVNERKGPGTYQVKFDATGLSSGMYVYCLTAGTYSQSRKMLVVR